MKIIVAFGFFLVAGILNSDLAQAEDAKKPPVKQTYADLLGKVKVNPFSDDSDEIEEELIKAKCNRNGGPAAYDNAIRGLADLENSIVAMINDTANSIESDVSDDSSLEEEDEIAVVCGAIMLLKDWAIKAIDAVKPCLDLNERVSVEILVGLSSPVIEYVCENGGSNFLGFVETGGIECLEAKADAIQTCFPDNSTSAESVEAATGSTSAAVIPRPFVIPEFNVVLEDCTELKTIQSCIIGHLNGCPQRTPSNFVNSIFNIVTRESGCKAILKAAQALKDL